MPKTPHSSRGPSRSGTSKRASVTSCGGVSTSGDRRVGQELSPHEEGSSGHGAVSLRWPPKMRRFAGTYFFFLACLTRPIVSCALLGTPATPAGTKWMKTFTFTFAFPFFLTPLLSFFAVLPVGLTARLNEDAPVMVSPTGLTAAAVALTSGGVLVWLSVIWPGPGTLALIVAVPFFFFLVTEFTVILLEGAAASREGFVVLMAIAPVIRAGFGEP